MCRFLNVVVVRVREWDHVIRALATSEVRSGKSAYPLAKIIHFLLASGLFSYLKTKGVFDFFYYICGIMRTKTGVQT